MIHPEFIPLGVSEPDGRVGAVENLVDADLLDLMSGAGIRRPAFGEPAA